MIKDILSILMRYVREGEKCGIPFIMMEKNIPVLAIFTYFSLEEPDKITIFGYGQLVKSDGENTVCEALKQFNSEAEFITITQPQYITIELRNSNFQNYYQALDRMFLTLQSGGGVDSETKTAVQKAFCSIIPEEGVELYNRICPDFVNSFLL